MKIVFLVIFLSCSTAWSETYDLMPVNSKNKSNFRFASMLSREALVTGRFLPFKVYKSEQAMGIAEIVIEEQTAGCSTMIDPYRPTLFHLYCLDEGTVSIKVLLSGTSDVVTARGLPIKHRSIIDFDNPDKPIDPLARGRVLFNNDCMRCHRSQAIPKPQTKTSVAAALNTSPMKEEGLPAQYVDPDKLSAIVQFINEGL